MKQWYYVKNNERFGPIGKVELLDKLNQKIITNESLVWTEGLEDWVKIKEVPELKQHQTPPTPAKKKEINSANSSNTTKRLQFAGFWRRAFAMIIDIIVMMIALFFLAGSFMLLTSTTSPDSTEGWSTILAFFLGWLYYAIWESSEYQATLGKMALGLKVTDTDGNQIDFGKASGRYFGKIISGLIFYIGYIMAAFTKKKQALHDMMSDCLVIKK